MISALVVAAPAAADTASFTQPGCSQWSVPAGVSSVSVDASGASGARGTGSTAGQGGQGAEITGSFSVTHGQVLDVCVAVGGGSAAGNGGAGGGASGVSTGADFSHPVVIAAGGGGGGASGSLAGGNGGAAGTAGSPAAGGAAGGSVGGGSATTANGPGAGGAGSGTGGGGGGAGYAGGGGGSGNSLGSGGGAGGTNYCGATGCSSGSAGGSPQVTLTYTVAAAPGASIAAPANGAVFAQGQTIGSSFSCSDGAGGSGISSCADGQGHGSGSPIDTASPGSHTFTVTAQSADGLSSTASVTYTVAAPPRIWLPLPGNGAVYMVGQVVHSWFQCGDGAYGPGLNSCVDQSGQPSGAALDTSSPGVHRFTVTATSADGQTSSTTVAYYVVPMPAVSHVATHRGGIVTLQVTLYGPGAIDVMSTAGLRSFALAADVVHPPNGSFVFGRAHLVSSRPQTLAIRVGLSQAGRLLLRDHRGATLRLWVLYTPPGGTPQLVKTLLLKISR